MGGREGNDSIGETGKVEATEEKVDRGKVLAFKRERKNRKCVGEKSSLLLA